MRKIEEKWMKFGSILNYLFRWCVNIPLLLLLVSLFRSVCVLVFFCGAFLALSLPIVNIMLLSFSFKNRMMKMIESRALNSYVTCKKLYLIFFVWFFGSSPPVSEMIHFFSLQTKNAPIFFVDARKKGCESGFAETFKLSLMQTFYR